MTSPERFQQVQELFHAALRLPAEERRVFLDSRCAGDDSVRRQIESLLSEDAHSSGILEAGLGARGSAEDAATLSIGARVGSYEITGVLGRGGMGEVYRARDTKLNRDVAVKVLPRELARDPKRVSRLRREAQLLASLNHPHVASIYALQEYEHGLALIMELVEGPTLAERIKSGPIPFGEALRISGQIAEAVGTAHERGIIHRDLKPANIKFTPEGAVKVLDFGLGKALNPNASPEHSANLTRTGLILGTTAYMSPEQARGEGADRRADIWAFGVLLYEMLAGERPFAGNTSSDTLAAVLTREPDWNRIPVQAQGSLRLCLEKDPARRVRDIWDAWTLLHRPQQTAPVRVSNAWLRASGFAVILALTFWIAWRITRRVETPLQPLVRLDVDLGRDLPLDSMYGADAILSPDGTRLLFVSQSRLFTRMLDQPLNTELAGTEGAHDPFFSPDGQWVGFFTPGKLKKVSVRGGAPIILCDTGLSSGGSWGEDGTIIAALDIFGLSRVSSAGGAPTQVTELGPGEAIHRWPQVLPGGNAVLFGVYKSAMGVAGSRIEVVSLKDRRRKIVQRNGAWARYLPSGHLIYLENDRILAAPFDLNRMEVRGVPSPVLTDVAHSALTDSAQVECSQTGTLVYRTRRTAAELMTLQLLRASGKTDTLLARPGYYLNPRFSPDGQRLALTSAGDIWVYELRRETMTRLTFDGGYTNPLWTVDGRCIVFRAPGGIFWIRADGVGKPQALTHSENVQVPSSFTSNGKRLAFVELNRVTGADLWTLPVDNNGASLRAGKPELFLQTPFNERAPAFSPDGRWLAYSSDETGVLEVYVRAYPGGAGKIQVSDGGGNFPVWSRVGTKLFLTNGDLENQLMIARYNVNGDSFRPEKARLWSNLRLPLVPPSRTFDVAPDGQSVIAMLPAHGQENAIAQRRVIFLEHFFDELRRRAGNAVVNSDKHVF